jgi:Uma2 family endonuclease
MNNTPLVTAEQLAQLPRGRCRYELVAGQLRERPLCGWMAGLAAGNLFSLVAEYADNAIGKTFVGATGFLLTTDPDTVRAPGMAFIRKDQLPAESPAEYFWPGPPDLAVEVVSPGDSFRTVDEKAHAWLEAGARMVWVVNSQSRTVSIYRAGSEIKTLTENDQITGEDVLEGFSCRVGEIFEGI